LLAGVVVVGLGAGAVVLGVVVGVVVFPHVPLTGFHVGFGCAASLARAAASAINRLRSSSEKFVAMI
jgi:hypothetical protein